MTIIDTTLYANGALRLSRHGAGRGGNVLMHVASGDQCNLSDGIAEAVIDTLSNPRNTITDARGYFDRVKGWHGFSAEPHRVRRGT